MSMTVFLAMIAVSALSVLAIWYIHKRQFTPIGQAGCRWFTTQSLIGIGFMAGYTAVAIYLYSTTLTPNYAGMVCIGIALGGFTVIYGQAAIGSGGVFWGGRLIPWNLIRTRNLSERRGNRLEWSFSWTASPGVAGEKELAITIPASQRNRAEKFIRDTAPTDGTEKDTH